MAEQKITIEQLATDEHFQQWVLSPNPSSDQFWEEWLLAHPQHKGTVQKARDLILSMQLESEPAPKELQLTVWEQIRINTEGTSKRKNISHIRLGRKWYGIAASLLLLMTVFTLYYFANNSVYYHTAYGETKTILLPDSSVVTLNANSSLHFTEDWKASETREIWLEGEAFFEVRQISLSGDNRSNMRLPFVVHSQNMDVEVLGTTFNVKDRESYSEVTLNTGKVSVTPKQEQNTAPIAMLPGDQLLFSSIEHEWRIQQVNPEVPTSWRNNELIFDEMKLEDIALILEETYGYKISIPQAEIRNYEFTGNIKTDEIEMLIPMLERSFGLNVDKNSNNIIFSKK